MAQWTRGRQPELRGHWRSTPSPEGSTALPEDRGSLPPAHVLDLQPPPSQPAHPDRALVPGVVTALQVLWWLLTSIHRTVSSAAWVGLKSGVLCYPSAPTLGAHKVLPPFRRLPKPT